MPTIVSFPLALEKPTGDLYVLNRTSLKLYVATKHFECLIVSGVQNKSYDKNVNDEVTLVENDLYSGKSANRQIDPSGNSDHNIVIICYCVKIFDKLGIQ